MNNVTVDARDLHRLSRNLREYIKVNSKSEDEILNAKGNELRLALYKRFRARKWDKGEKKSINEILSEIGVNRTSGINVRAKDIIGRYAGRIPDVDKNANVLSDWQQLVAQETIRRSAGVGVLSVGFLRRKWRGKGEKRYLIENKTKDKKLAATFEKKEGEFIVTGFTEGHEKVLNRYGIKSGAISDVSANIEKYLSRKLGPEFLKNLHRA